MGGGEVFLVSRSGKRCRVDHTVIAVVGIYFVPFFIVDRQW